MVVDEDKQSQETHPPSLYIDKAYIEQRPGDLLLNAINK